MPILHRYVAQSDKSGWYVYLTRKELVSFGLVSKRPVSTHNVTHQVSADGNAFFDAMGYKDGDAIERPLYWMLFKRGLVYLGETPPGRPELVTSEEWAEICDIVARRTLYKSEEVIRTWLRLSDRELNLLRKYRSRIENPARTAARHLPAPVPAEKTSFSHKKHKELDIPLRLTDPVEMRRWLAEYRPGFSPGKCAMLVESALEKRPYRLFAPRDEQEHHVCEEMRRRGVSRVVVGADSLMIYFNRP